ncbi:hypothetical protein BDQ12DRAFT_734981 [Crucibulum laeve]|uniref:Uncharacterized protein n=1 Tax=Crucibulum laeve TaxID=68775 RepID=A0A5C3MD94_9AGAR|nr:hypothetical protein BDQ12DRAFT_734981 [Crucibulum laeve]
MGTRGYIVYRRRGWYIRKYNHFDSYPSGLGVEMLSSVPKDTKRYKVWFTEEAARLDALIKKVPNVDDTHDADKIYTVLDNEGDEIDLMRSPPCNDLFIEWIYEIDLDNEVFHVDSEPLFRLDHLPPEEIFLESIGFDSYRHRAYVASTPEEYRYNWTASPPEVDAKLNELYHSLLTPSQADLPAHMVCGLPEHLTRCETVRIRLYEALVGLCLKNSTIASSLRRLESIRTRSEIPEMLKTLAVGLVALILHPIVLGHRIRTQSVITRSIMEYTWVHQDVCVFIATHLNDESNRQAAIAEIITEIRCHSDVTRVTYGICFSFFHCVIVRIDVDGTVKHTDALPFIPSFYATSPSTNGITALARLFSTLQVQLPKLNKSFRNRTPAILAMLDNLPGMDKDNKEMKTSRIHEKFPVEVWSYIVHNLFELQDLVSAAEISPQSKAAVLNVLRYPSIGRYRLIDIIPRNGNGAGGDTGHGITVSGDHYDDDDSPLLCHLWQATFRGASDYAHNDGKVLDVTVCVHSDNEKLRFPEGLHVKASLGLFSILDNIFELYSTSSADRVKGRFTVATYLGDS